MEVPTMNDIPQTQDETTYDELYELAKELDIRGRGDMVKAELFEAVTEAVDELTEAPSKVEEGDEVEMNHLASTLTVQEVLDDAVVMVTPRGGKHKLVTRDEPHLERWRADTKEWMNNSDEPTEFTVVA